MPSPDVELTDQRSSTFRTRADARLDRRGMVEEKRRLPASTTACRSADCTNTAKRAVSRPGAGDRAGVAGTKRPNAAWAERYRPGFAKAMAFLETSQQASVAENERAKPPAARAGQANSGRIPASSPRTTAGRQQVRKLIGGLASWRWSLGWHAWSPWCITEATTWRWLRSRNRMSPRRAPRTRIVNEKRRCRPAGDGKRLTDADRERKTAVQAQNDTKKALTQLKRRRRGGHQPGQAERPNKSHEPPKSG